MWQADRPAVSWQVCSQVLTQSLCPRVEAEQNAQDGGIYKPKGRAKWVVVVTGALLEYHTWAMGYEHFIVLK